MSSPPSADAPRDSSPLFFDTSSPAKRRVASDSRSTPVPVTPQRRTQQRSDKGLDSTPLRFSSAAKSNASGGGLFFPPSTGGGSSARARRVQDLLRDEIRMGSSEGNVNGNGDGSDSGLVFPGSANATPVRGRNRKPPRGDIHSSVPFDSPSHPQNARPRGQPASSQADPLPSSNIDVDMNEELEINEPRTVIWGTLVSINRTISFFRSFLSNFRAGDRGKLYPPKFPASPYSDEDSDKRIYWDLLRKMRETGETNINLSMLDLWCFGSKGKECYDLLINWPHEVVPVFDQCVKDMIIEQAEQEGASNEDLDELESAIFKVRPVGGESGEGKEKDRWGIKGDKENLGKGVRMRDLNPADIDKLVSIKGLVIRTTTVIPDMKTAFFRCISCSHTVTSTIDRGRISEPERCPREVCNLQGGMQLIHNRCEFSDRQVVRLQETPDAVPDGQTPYTVSLCLYDELVDVAKPGDRITITGIFRSVPVRQNPKQRVIKSLFKTYVDVVHVRRTTKGRLGVDATTRAGGKTGMNVGVGVAGLDAMERDELEGEDRVMDELASNEDGEGGNGETGRRELEKKLRQLSTRPDIYDLLSRSVAPSIWEMDDVKKGILLQMFGGTNKSIERGGGGGGPRYRGDINVLLVGDPGTSKSQLLSYVHRIAPRGVYTSGKGSSAVGLTAYVTRDPESRQLVLESGALVLSDGGICCIDEFDKMSDATRSVLHEVMEQQTVSVAKAGIITTLNARTSILAAANPVNSKYDRKQPITKNIDLPPTLISRFDLLYLVLDQIDETMDRRLAKFLVGLYLEDRPETGGYDILPIETLTAYISYARNNIHPVLTEGASTELVKSYVEMRKVGEDVRGTDKRITATTRQLESMIRLSEAHARMKFSETVEQEDVMEAYRLIRAAIKESATDPNTGLIDLDLLNTGQGAQQRRLRSDLRREVLLYLETNDTSNRGVRWSELMKGLEGQSSIRIEHAEFSDILRALENEGLLKVTGERDRRTVKRLVA